jgi:hypothetical protein
MHDTQKQDLTVLFLCTYLCVDHLITLATAFTSPLVFTGGMTFSAVGFLIRPAIFFAAANFISSVIAVTPLSRAPRKIPGNTRIPEGHYRLGIKKENTPLTERYRNRFDWFSNHIEIEGIPNYDLVYIHIGNTHKDTKGCLLIADGVNAANREKMILQSQRAYERFYKIIYPRIVNNEPLAINILDENWIEKVSKITQLEKA